MDNTNHLKNLGSAETKYEYLNPNYSILEVFENQYPIRDYNVVYEFDEFTSLCPKTGQPDFATIKVSYIPDRFCIETKSLKLYFLAYRQYGSFMETIVNKILEDCIFICRPRKMEISGFFNARGGTKIKVTASYTKEKS